jgi:hypothetical protein
MTGTAPGTVVEPVPGMRSMATSPKSAPVPGTHRQGHHPPPAAGPGLAGGAAYGPPFHSTVAFGIGRGLAGWHGVGSGW